MFMFCWWLNLVLCALCRAAYRTLFTFCFSSFRIWARLDATSLMASLVMCFVSFNFDSSSASLSRTMASSIHAATPVPRARRHAAIAPRVYVARDGPRQLALL